jgi:predicted enzyme related to lactoylglutathione lyase
VSIGEAVAIGVDVADLDRAAGFWSEVLGVRKVQRKGQYLTFEPLESGISIYLQKVPERKSAKNRVHLDILVKDLEAAQKQVEALGGKTLQAISEDGSRWVVMQDLDGNEFCIGRG